MTQRGRPRKYTWFSSIDLETQFCSEAQYLKWASANNIALQAIAATGCPHCHRKKFELRHDKKYKIIRFHCLECNHETSYRPKMPKPGSFQIVPILHNGVKISEKIVDSYHPATKRQRSDALVLKFRHGIESGIISLGGEWHVDGKVGGLNDQKRHYLNLREVKQLCNWNRMQLEHEKRLQELEKETRFDFL
jgi:hypothetical protein